MLKELVYAQYVICIIVCHLCIPAFDPMQQSLNWYFLQASSQEGASKVFELLQGKAFRSVGWSTLFDCLNIYAEKFKQSLLTTGAMLPEFQEGDAKALVAYLNVLQKVGFF